MEKCRILGPPSATQQFAGRPTAHRWQDIVPKRPTQLRLMANNVRQRDSKSLGNGIVREGPLLGRCRYLR